LNEINASQCVDEKGRFSEESFYESCKLASWLGTMQAGYTSFPYLGEETERMDAVVQNYLMRKFFNVVQK